MSNNSDLGVVVATADGSFTLQHPELDENYHCLEGAEREAQDLYIGSSEFCGAIDQKEIVRVLDVGFGLGYNAMTTICNWNSRSSASANLSLVSLENNVALAETFVNANGVWQQNWSTEKRAIAQFLQEVSFGYQADLVHATQKQLSCNWQLHIGDARDFSNSEYAFDFIWQDPFSPEKNPTMWTAEWFVHLHKLSHPKTQLLSYSVSRVVKDALTEAGWAFEVIPTTMKKRSWLRAMPSTI